MLVESARGKLACFLLTREGMAQMIGSSRETVTRTLAACKRGHLVEKNGATFIIHNRMALESMVPA